MAEMPEPETFGSRLKRRRRELGLTQRQLAQKVGIDFTYLSKLENDQPGQSPSEDLVLKLARVLDDEAEVLLVLAGKVPVEPLRERASQSHEFAHFLRTLPDRSLDDIRRWNAEIAKRNQSRNK